MTIVITVLIVAACAAVGVWVYLHNGPDGGRDPGLNSEQVRSRRMRRLLDDNADEMEQKFQDRQQPPTHDG